LSDPGLVLVDTSVWIDFLSPRPGAAGEELRRLIEDTATVALTGIVVTEILPGLLRDADTVEEYLVQWDLLELDGFEAYVRAAKLFRVARSRGLTMTTVDILIATLAIDYGARLFTLDQDFAGLAKFSALKLY
jgi:predicted nucleic acid-binding protein